VTRAPTFAAGLADAQRLGFLKAWTVTDAEAAAQEALEDIPKRFDRDTAGTLFQIYYGEGITELGRKDGVIILDYNFGQSTDRPAEDLLAVCHDAPDIEIVSTSGGDRVRVAGETIDLTEGLAPLVAALNACLVDHKLYGLDFDADFYTFAYRDGSFPERVAATAFLVLEKP
jgi:hypothetical protein